MIFKKNLTRSRNDRSKKILLTILFLLPAWGAASAKTRLPDLKDKLAELNDQPAPATLQVTTVGPEATLTWEWALPETHPDFKSFGFEVERQDGKMFVVPGTTFSDYNLAFGTYTYRVRVLGEDREKGKHLWHTSDWSEPVAVVINVSCSQAPIIQLTAQPAETPHPNTPPWRLRLIGSATVPKGCQLTKTIYHIDLIDGTHRTGDLSLDTKGRFDQDVEVSSEDDGFDSPTSYIVSVIAEDEAGPTTSDAFTLQFRKHNPFAPKNSDD